ncbi:Ribonuclease 2 [Castilleja foliolosa]|uniref:Ribonuclease 2 n=1 Tax=Castilleja foliolosa TaxID=1961234 RepID=A0ABD3EFX2_9LAMI
MVSPSLPTRQMQCAFISLLWIGLSCIAVEINGDGDFGELFGRLGNKQREFDYFMLSLQWPGTACRATRHCCSSNACCLRPDALTEFTIHGLWPDYNDGTWPACCSGKIFDVKEISTLLSGLNKYWPSLSCDAPSNCHGGKGLFWEHEWEKHGTCSSPAVRDEYDYFLTTLNLYFKYNVTEVLREAGYVASNSEKYPLKGIVSAIQNAYHATPEFQCSGDAVEELRLCFHKDFKLRNCSVESNTKTGKNNSDESCPRYVSLPEVVSLKHENSGSFTM